MGVGVRGCVCVCMGASGWHGGLSSYSVSSLSVRFPWECDYGDDSVWRGFKSKMFSLSLSAFDLCLSLTFFLKNRRAIFSVQSFILRLTCLMQHFKNEGIYAWLCLLTLSVWCVCTCNVNDNWWNCYTTNRRLCYIWYS